MKQRSGRGGMVPMTLTSWLRIALGYLGLTTSTVGLWALVAPRSFYDDFPGLGQVWVAVDGPYNEHLVRDVGALNLALTVLFVCAMWRPTRFLATTAAVAALVYGVPHLLYHVFNTAGLDEDAIVSSLTGLAAFTVVPVMIIIAASGLERVEDPSDSPI